MKTNLNRLVPEEVCAKCGKKFIVAPQHVFKVCDKKKKTKYYCSWSCYNHRNDKEKENEQREAD